MLQDCRALCCAYLVCALCSVLCAFCASCSVLDGLVMVLAFPGFVPGVPSLFRHLSCRLHLSLVLADCRLPITDCPLPHMLPLAKVCFVHTVCSVLRASESRVSLVKCLFSSLVLVACSSPPILVLAFALPTACFVSLPLVSSAP